MPASIQTSVPEAVGKPVTKSGESESVLNVIAFVPDGLKRTLLFAVKSPSTVRSLLTVVNPVVSPSEITVASPPMFKVVALVLKREAVPAVVVMSPPFNAKSPADVMSPVNVDVPSMIKLPFAERLPVLVILRPVEP